MLTRKVDDAQPPTDGLKSDDLAPSLELQRRGLMLVFSSPSGAGKTTISRRLLAKDDNLWMSVSVTTRPRRPGEIDDTDYRFVDHATFENMVQSGALLEHAKVFDHYYGTPRGPVEDSLKTGKDVLFDIDWQGAQQIAHMARDDVVKIFILPPSTAELERRLRQRAQDSSEVVASRMARASDEMTHWAEYDYVIINRDIDESVSAVAAILKAERLRRPRQLSLNSFVEQLIQGR